MARSVLALLAALVLSLSPLSLPALAGPSSSPAWTLAVYLCGSDLESDSLAATSDLVEMLGADFDPSILHLYVMTGGARTWNTAPEMFAWRELEAVEDPSGSYITPSSERTQIFRIDRLDHAPDTTLNGLEIHNRMVMLREYDHSMPMNEGSTLAEFLDYVICDSPTERIMVLLWDHGAGPVTGALRDQITEQYMSLNDLQSSLKHACETRKSLGLPGKIDLVGFDCCLMSSLETAWALHECADYLVASEEAEWQNGWDYSFLKVFNTPDKRREVLNASYDQSLDLTAGTDQDAFCVEIGKTVVNRYPHQSYLPNTWMRTKENDSLTMAVLDLRGEALPHLCNAVSRLGEAYLDLLTASPDTITRLSRQMEFLPQMGLSCGLQDLYQLCSLISQIPDQTSEAERVRTCALTVLEMLEGSVLNEGVSSGVNTGKLVLYRGSTPDYASCGGLSVYWPTSTTRIESRDTVRSVLQNLAFGRDFPGWISVLPRLMIYPEGDFHASLEASWDEALHTLSACVRSTDQSDEVLREISKLNSVTSSFLYLPETGPDVFTLGILPVVQAWEQNLFTSMYNGRWMAIEGEIFTVTLFDDMTCLIPVMTYGQEQENGTDEMLLGHLEDVSGSGGLIVFDCVAYNNGDQILSRPYVPGPGFSFQTQLNVTPQSYRSGGNHRLNQRITLTPDQVVETSGGTRCCVRFTFEALPRGTCQASFHCLDLNGGTTDSNPVTLPLSGFDTGRISTDPIPDQKYTGAEICPKPVVWLDNEILSDPDRVSYAYRDNIQQGIAVVLVTVTGQDMHETIPVYFAITP